MARERKRRNSQGKDPRTFEEHSQVEANRWKGGEFKKSGRKRSGKRGRKRT